MEKSEYDAEASVHGVIDEAGKHRWMKAILRGLPYGAPSAEDMARVLETSDDRSVAAAVKLLRQHAMTIGFAAKYGDAEAARLIPRAVDCIIAVNTTGPSARTVFEMLKARGPLATAVLPQVDYLDRLEMQTLAKDRSWPLVAIDFDQLQWGETMRILQAPPKHGKRTMLDYMASFKAQMAEATKNVEFKTPIVLDSLPRTSTGRVLVTREREFRPHTPPRYKAPRAPHVRSIVVSLALRQFDGKLLDGAFTWIW